MLDSPIFSTLKFDKANEKWIDFVIENRINPNFKHDYDFVYGVVANDRVYGSLTLFQNGFIDKAVLINNLKTYKLVDQLLFHTQKAIETLTYLEALKV